MTSAEIIALAVLETYAGPFYVAGTDTQRARVLAEAARAIEPMLRPVSAKHCARGRITGFDRRDDGVSVTADISRFAAQDLTIGAAIDLEWKGERRT